MLITVIPYELGEAVRASCAELPLKSTSGGNGSLSVPKRPRSENRDRWGPLHQVTRFSEMSSVMPCSLGSWFNEVPLLSSGHTAKPRPLEAEDPNAHALCAHVIHRLLYAVNVFVYTDFSKYTDLYVLE